MGVAQGTIVGPFSLFDAYHLTKRIFEVIRYADDISNIIKNIRKALEGITSDTFK